MTARVVGVVHAQQADDAEWNRPHRHQGGELHTAAKETLVHGGLLQLLHPMLTHHIQGQRLVKAGQFALGEPGGQRGQHPFDQALFVVVAGFEKALDQTLQAAHPVVRGVGLLQPLAAAQNVLQPLEQGLHQRAVQPAHAGGGQHLMPQA